jgi:hypothetical protein
METKEEREDRKYWFKVLLVSFGSVVLLHFIHYWWSSQKQTAEDIDPNSFLFNLITAVILPVYLMIFNYEMCRRANKPTDSFIANGFVVIFCICLAIYLETKTWESLGGNTSGPGSNILPTFEAVISFIIILIGGAFSLSALKKRDNKDSDFPSA